MRGTGPITRKEEQVLALLAECCTYEDISEKLGISITTVYCHVYSIMIKTDIHKKELLIKYAQDRRKVSA